MKNCKNAKKNVAAFDDLNYGQAENQVFGTSTTEKVKHFDQIISELLNTNKEKYAEKSDWKDTYPDDYLNDFGDQDSMGNNVTTRLNIYNPMYYLIDYYDGYKTSDVADHFRINTGLFQSDTGNVVEMNLYLALLNYGKDVEFTTVWEKEHVEAERTGTSTANFISWVTEIEKGGDTDDTTDNNFSNIINMSYFLYLLSLLILF